MKIFVAAATVATVLISNRRAEACYWDRDTLAMEKRSLPGSLELLTGKFLRHSADFYRWRVADRIAKLSTSPNDLSLLDDLAVAHDKLGDHAKALVIARRALKLAPKRYEAHANLGTILIHAGELEKGLVHINKAIEINPKAHFGREVFQKLLVEYVLEKRASKSGTLSLEETWDEFQCVSAAPQNATDWDKLEQAAASRWWARIERDEKRWIKQRKDPEKAFARKYFRTSRQRAKTSCLPLPTRAPSAAAVA